jgi:DNA invertase Pin-like site-specific DNA recombinase
MNNIKKYFVYVRKSTEDKDKQVASISSQIDELKKVSDRMGYEIVQGFSKNQNQQKPPM